ncbi:MAG: bifunctional folylpolyglutamate synthase/dihydrofolate synthase [Oscillospiraceae bacterium]|nr:bifunctional folylpolyglutamate synthase/dihydrofolate synthase [Oscillospiraceae bacterium]
MMTYEQAMQKIQKFSKSGAPLQNLDRIRRLLDSVGNPQKDLKFIHIAGTNGKGSVAEYLTDILQAAGFCTGTFTSPYIREYADRIRMNSRNIPEDAVCRFCETVLDCHPDPDCSQFEITLAIGLLYFREQHTDFVILETGIGGLLDATNIIEKPLVSVLTSVSRDHMQILGDTIPEIAAHKAGIIKESCPVVISPHNKAEKLFRQTAAEKHCEVFTPDESLCDRKETGLEGCRFGYRDAVYQTKMGGMHQIDNALTALETIQVLRQNYDYNIPENAVKKALAKTVVPARIQIVQTNPLVILDGGHNVDGIGVLTDLLSESGIASWIGICGMTNTKDANAAAFQLSLILSKVLCVDGFSGNALPKEQLRDAFVKQHAMASVTELEKALPYAIRWAKGSHGGVVICGSLYLASWYLHQNEVTSPGV